MAFEGGGAGKRLMMYGLAESTTTSADLVKKAGMWPAADKKDPLTGNSYAKAPSHHGSIVNSPRAVLHALLKSGDGLEADLEQAGGQSQRSDSPDSGGGGYFTLSDSDHGTESPQEEEIQRSNTIYKFFKQNVHNDGNFRPAFSQAANIGNEQVSPKPALAVNHGIVDKSTAITSSCDRPLRAGGQPGPEIGPKHEELVESSRAEQNCDDSGAAPPPRPPPPTLYASTLPPPVPKKTKLNPNKKYVSKTLPPSSSKMAKSKSAPIPTAPSTPKAERSVLERLQPLQIQSPSMIEALKSSNIMSNNTRSNKIGEAMFLDHHSSSSDECLLSSRESSMGCCGHTTATTTEEEEDPATAKTVSFPRKLPQSATSKSVRGNGCRSSSGFGSDGMGYGRGCGDSTSGSASSADNTPPMSFLDKLAGLDEICGRVDQTATFLQAFHKAQESLPVNSLNAIGSYNMGLVASSHHSEAPSANTARPSTLQNGRSSTYQDSKKSSAMISSKNCQKPVSTTAKPRAQSLSSAAAKPLGDAPRVSPPRASSEKRASPPKMAPIKDKARRSSLASCNDMKERKGMPSYMSTERRSSKSFDQNCQPLSNPKAVKPAQSFTGPRSSIDASGSKAKRVRSVTPKTTSSTGKERTSHYHDRSLSSTRQPLISEKSSSGSMSNISKPNGRVNGRVQARLEKPSKVASESLAERARNTSEERLNRFKKNLIKQPVLSDRGSKSKSSPRKSLSVSESDRDSNLSDASCQSNKSTVSQKSGKLGAKTTKESKNNASKTMKRSSKDRSASGGKSKDDSGSTGKLFPQNPIKNLIKFYESSDKITAVDTATSDNSKVPVVLEDKYGRVLFKRSSRSPTPSLVSGSCTESSSFSVSLSQLSQLSQERVLETWLASPFNSFALKGEEFDMSITEIAILDQCVHDLLSITKGIKTPRSSSVYLEENLNSNDLISLLDQKKRQSKDEALKSSLQYIMAFVENKWNSTKDNEEPGAQGQDHSQVQQSQQQLPIKKDPTDADLQKGCFTEVSYAGTFRHSSKSMSPSEEDQSMEDKSEAKLEAKNASSSGGCFTEISFAGTFAKQQSKNEQKSKPERRQSIDHTSISDQVAAEQKDLSLKDKEVSSIQKASEDNKSTQSSHANESQPEMPIENKNLSVPKEASPVPSPSPRLKKRARKEQLLQQHKLYGKDVLDQIAKERSPTKEVTDKVQVEAMGSRCSTGSTDSSSTTMTNQTVISEASLSTAVSEDMSSQGLSSVRDVTDSVRQKPANSTSARRSDSSAVVVARPPADQSAGPRPVSFTGLDSLLHDLEQHSAAVRESITADRSRTTSMVTSCLELDRDNSYEDISVLSSRRVKESDALSLTGKGLGGQQDDPASETDEIFLRGGLLNKLEEAREAKLGEKIVRLQALARGHLARQKLQRLKTQDIALRCIQKNVRKFTAVREWPWWRLLVKVTPLLNVHRTEEQLKQREDEVEALRQKLEKAEKERAEFKELSEKQDARLRELSADLGEEQTAAQLATERLEAEQAERMKLEREKAELVNKNRSLTTSMEKLETELIHSRTRELQGTMLSESVEDEDNVYRGKYERCMKDLEYTRKCLAQQHEDDLEQLLAVKKQLEKKLNDAYEEVEEQRQALSQWKRKAQKVQAEMNDTRLLLEEQTARNSLLEKKQRKFDSELGMVQEDLRQESASKEKLQRELEAIKSEKSRLEDELNHANNELDSRQERITSMDREIDRLQMGGGASEDEMRALKQQKQDLEHTVKDQEEELDDLAGQVSLLEGAKTRLEMELATVRKEHRREVASKDEELEDARASAVKKVKILEEQLEQEHEERLQHIRERHEMEGRILLLQDMLDRSGDDEQISKLKKDLKRTKALLKDAQMMLDKTQNEGTNKVIIRQLKNQLEDAELARTSALKARQNAELELADTQQQLDDIMRAKQDLDEKLLRLAREKCELSCNMQETEEELQEIMRKYKASVAAGTSDQITIQDQQVNIQELETERNKLRESLAELSIRLSSLEGENVTNAQHKRLELKLREMESKLELEVTTKTRMETQISRLKEAVEKATKDCDDLRMREQSGQDLTRKLNRQLRELREDYTNLQCKETESCEKKNDLEKQLELAEAEIVTLRSDLKLALKRIDDLQAAIQGDLDTSGDSNLSSDESSDDDINTFLENHHVSMPREKGTAEQLSETSIPEVDESQA